MNRPVLGFEVRETGLGVYKFQGVVFTSSRHSKRMTKTWDPHARLLDEVEVRNLGYDTQLMIENYIVRRLGLPCFKWRHHAISYQDMW